MTRALLITTGLPTMLGDILSHALVRYPDVELVVAAAPPGGLGTAVRDAEPDVVIGAESQLPGAVVCALLDGFPRSRVFTVTTDARMAWLCELRPERVALGELSPERLAEAIRAPRAGLCRGAGHG